MLIEKNKVMNLTPSQISDEVIEKHFLDSLFYATLDLNAEKISLMSEPELVFPVFLLR